MFTLAESSLPKSHVRMYRMYVDEVGTDALAPLETDSQRYLSLTGVIMDIGHARDALVPELNRLKADIFRQDPDEPLCLHRKDIMAFKGKFGALRDEGRRDAFDAHLLRVFSETEYAVITAFIDKAWMLRQRHWRKSHPYHYLMEIVTEKYAQWLDRRNATGDIMPEARHGNSDKALQASFDDVRASGTRFVDRDLILSRIPASSLKFRTKRDNIAGLQLCDLLAHPSHYVCRGWLGHVTAPGPFAVQVQSIMLGAKYDRSRAGVVRGYGVKTLG